MEITSPAKGTQFACYVAALARCKGDPDNAAAFAARQWPAWPVVATTIRAAAVSPGDPNTPGWASELVHYGLAADFLSAVRSRTVVDRLTNARRAPFHTNVPRETGSTGGTWAAPGAMIPLSKSAFENVALARYKAASMIALMGELLQSLSPAALASIRETLVAGVVQFLDQQFLDPSIAEVTDVSPASIANGGIEITASGSTAAAMTADFSNMLDAAEDLVNPVWIARGKTVASIAGTLGLPGVKLTGGELFGIPIIATKSQATPPGSPALARYITLIDEDAVLLADDGAVDVSMSHASALQMDDAPSAGAQNVVSLFQTGGAVARVIREIAWKRTRDTGVVFMEVSY